MNTPVESRGGNRIYVWIIATGTLLLIGLFLWPLSVKDFRTTLVFSLRYQPTSGIEKSALNTWVIDSLRDQTNRTAIAEIFSQMGSEMTSNVLSSLDPDVIRDAIHIQGRPGTTANSVQYQLSIVGEGSSDEIEFINMVVSRINNQLDSQLSDQNNIIVVKKLTEDLERFHDGRLTQVSSQLTGIMNGLTTAQNDIQIVTGDLQNLTSTSVSHRAAVMGRPAPSKLESLYAERQRLLNQPGMTEYHPEVGYIQRKIETLKGDLPRISGPQIDGQPANQFRAQVVKNPFAPSNENINNNDSGNHDSSLHAGLNLDAEPESENDFFAPVGEILTGLEMIDLSPTRQALRDIQDIIGNFEVTEAVTTRLNERAIGELRTDSPVSLSGFEMAKRGTPIGGAPNITQFMVLALLAGMFGTIVTLNYDPSTRRTPFRSVDQLQRKLSIPVIGVLRNRTVETHRPFNKRAAARIVQVCEWTLLALAVLLILAALANSEVAAAFMENPFHGITKTIWLMSPNH